MPWHACTVYHGHAGQYIAQPMHDAGRVTVATSLGETCVRSANDARQSPRALSKWIATRSQIDTASHQTQAQYKQETIHLEHEERRRSMKGAQAKPCNNTIQVGEIRREPSFPSHIDPTPPPNHSSARSNTPPPVLALYLDEENLVTALVPSEMACLESSPGRMSRTEV